MFDGKDDLNEHMSEVHPRDTVFICEECSYTVTDSSNFDRHLASQRHKNKVGQR